MAILSTKDAIVRFDENEDRINKFVNGLGTYSTNSGLPDVETLPSFMQRNNEALNLLTATNIKGNWTSSTLYSVWDEVQYSGTWYRCVVAHTSTGTFDSTKWRISQGVSLGNLASNYGASLIGFSRDGTHSRTVENRLKDIVNVKDFGAVGDGITDDSSAIQSAINYLGTIGGGILQVPAGNYLLKSPITPCNYLTIQGQTTGMLGGASPSCSFFIVQNTTGAFSAASVVKFCIRDIGFAAQGSGVGAAYVYKQTNLSFYSERCEFYNVNIWANLAGGFFGNFILTTWRRCEFGYYSSASGQFWPIYSKGQISGNQTNANLIEDCYILNSLGSYTVYFEAGSDVTIRNTRFQSCFSGTTISLLGILSSTVEGCYFEDCNGVGTLAPIAYGNDTTNAQGCSTINFFGNYGSLSSNNTHLITHSGASGSINAIGNRFEGLTGKHFVISSGYGNDAPFASYLGNVTAGFSGVQEGVVNTSGSFSPTVASYSGTITSYSASASWSKVGKLAFLTAQVTITNNGTGSTLLQITGLPAAITPDFSTVIAYAGTGINHSNGKSLSVEIQSAGTATVNVYLYDGTYPVATGNVIEFAIQFRTTN